MTTDLVPLGDALAGDARTLTAEQRTIIEDILDAAVEVEAGRMPLMTFAKLGTWPAGGPVPYDGPPACGRFQVVRFTKKADPRRAALLRLVDKLILLQNVRYDSRGWAYTRGELEAQRVWEMEGRRIPVGREQP